MVTKPFSEYAHATKISQEWGDHRRALTRAEWHGWGWVVSCDCGWHATVQSKTQAVRLAKAHSPVIVRRQEPSPEAVAGVPLTDDDTDPVVALADSGLSRAEISERLGIDRSEVYRRIRGDRGSKRGRGTGARS